MRDQERGRDDSSRKRNEEGGNDDKEKRDETRRNDERGQDDEGKRNERRQNERDCNKIDESISLSNDNPFTDLVEWQIPVVRDGINETLTSICKGELK